MFDVSFGFAVNTTAEILPQLPACFAARCLAQQQHYDHNQENEPYRTSAYPNNVAQNWGE